MNRARIRRSGSSPWAGKSFSYTKGSIQLCSNCHETDEYRILPSEQELVLDFPVRLGLFPEHHIQGAACSLPQPHQTLGVQKETQPRPPRKPLNPPGLPLSLGAAPSVQLPKTNRSALRTPPPLSLASDEGPRSVNSTSLRSLPSVRL